METAGRYRRNKEEKLKPKTKDLMKKRRDMVKQGTVRDRVEYSELCKTIRKMMRDDIREHNTLKIKEAMETGKGLKKVKSQEGRKLLILALKEKDGHVTTNRERILERCAEFYQNLYEYTVRNIIKVDAEDVPPIIDCEVEKALQQSFGRRASGEDTRVRLQ